MSQIANWTAEQAWVIYPWLDQIQQEILQQHKERFIVARQYLSVNNTLLLRFNAEETSTIISFIVSGVIGLS